MTIRQGLAALVTVAVAALAPATALTAQELASARESLPPPEPLAEPVRDQLSREAVVVTRGTSRLEFWWRRGLPLSADTPDWTQVPPGALLGALRLVDPLPDIRGYTIPPGIYTLRFALQPQDGDHMGVSPYRQFLIVSPAADDRTAEPLGLDGAVELGKKTQNRSHPAVLSIDPPASREPPGAIVGTEEGHTAVVHAVPVVRDGAPAGALTFGLILVGRIEH
jgi:hypothetical protein